MEKSSWSKILEIRNLKKYFGGVKAVDGCDFEIKKGTITALIGPNGAGKSTLFNLILGMLNPDSGKIIFNPVPEQARYGASGRNIIGMKPEQISELGISRLFQQSRLFNNLTVKENLLLAMDNEDTKFWSAFAKASADKKNRFERQIKEMLELIGLEEFENKIARDLSYGQKRLVELIRAVLNPHIFLMLDEPVAGVNPKLRKTIEKLLLKLKKHGETILLIEHDIDFAFDTADEVIVMDQGKIIAQGKPAKIKNNPRVLEAYLGE
jgi:branched-chain amino acid transport system ATP-binding protein